MHRVAHFVSGFPILSETFVQDEIAAFSAAGVENVIVSLRPKPSGPVGGGRTLEELGVIETLYPGESCRPEAGSLVRVAPSLVGSGLASPGELTRMAWTAKRVAETAKRLVALGIDHCHAHFAHYPASMAWGCAAVLGKSYSFNAHSYDLFKYRAHRKRRIRDAVRAFPISEWNRAAMIRFGELSDSAARRIEVVRCGIRLEDYPYQEVPRSDPSAPKRIVGVGRLVDTKGLVDLVRATALVFRRHGDVQLEIVGDGPERGRLEQTARGLGIADRVHFHGALPRERTREIQRSADLVVQPSCSGTDGLDGIPVVLMEAMALGVPVISTRFESIPELVEDGVTGLLAPPGDSNALAECIGASLEQSDRIERMRRTARTRIEQEYNGEQNYRAKVEKVLS